MIAQAEPPDPTDSAAASAFNAGCDARLNGEPRGFNPYLRTEERPLWREWDHGWSDVQRHWGTLCRYPHLARPLPPVVGMRRRREAS